MFQGITILLCSIAILISASDELNSRSVTAPLSPKNTHLSSNTTTKNETTTHIPTSNVISTTPATSTNEPTTNTTPTDATTTTEYPMSSTTPKVSTPVPSPSIGKWSVNSTNATCIVLQMAAQFVITYNITNKTISQKINVPIKNVTVGGNCSAEEQFIKISWNSTLGYFNDSLTLNFLKNETSKNYAIKTVNFTIVPQELPNYNFSSNNTLSFLHEHIDYPTKLGNSYRCANPSKFNLTNNEVQDIIAVGHITNLQFQAFRSDKSSTFGLAEDCLSETPDIVPIAVGCALAALVVIVLVAYLIGRRRAQAHGYLSM